MGLAGSGATVKPKAVVGEVTLRNAAKYCRGIQSVKNAKVDLMAVSGRY